MMTLNGTSYDVARMVSKTIETDFKTLLERELTAQAREIIQKIASQMAQEIIAKCEIDMRFENLTPVVNIYFNNKHEKTVIKESVFKEVKGPL